jgi:hypothetical protein
MFRRRMIAVAAVAAIAVAVTAGIIFAQFGRSTESTPAPIGGPFGLLCRYQLRHFSEVLGGCCEEELVARTIRSS